MNMSTAMQPSSGQWREMCRDAAGYWESRRVWYNLVLVAVALSWLGLTWPHFRPALSARWVPEILILVALANLCYCAAYVVDLTLQRSTLQRHWKKKRWVLWSSGMLLAIVFENYWIVDEIYPSVG